MITQSLQMANLAHKNMVITAYTQLYTILMTTLRLLTIFHAGNTKNQMIQAKR